MSQAPTSSAISRNAAKSIRRGYAVAPADDHLRAVLEGQVADLVVVDQLGVLAHAVARPALNHLPEKLTLRAVGEVAAVRQAHRQHRVAGLSNAAYDREVGARAGVRLQVGVLGAEELLRPRDADLLGPVDDLAAAVVAPAGIALGVLVGQRASRARRARPGEVKFSLAMSCRPPRSRSSSSERPRDLGVHGGQGVEVRSPEMLAACHVGKPHSDRGGPRRRRRPRSGTTASVRNRTRRYPEAWPPVGRIVRAVTVRGSAARACVSVSGHGNARTRGYQSAMVREVSGRGRASRPRAR